MAAQKATASWLLTQVASNEQALRATQDELEKQLMRPRPFGLARAATRRAIAIVLPLPDGQTPAGKR